MSVPAVGVLVPIPGRNDLQILTFTANGRVYALNGIASSHAKKRGFSAIEEIWKANPNVPGLRINISPIIDRGLALAGDKQADVRIAANREPAPKVESKGGAPGTWIGKGQDVSIEVQYTITQDRRVVVTGTSNLPQNAELIVSLRATARTSNPAQCKVTVGSDGKFTTPSLGPKAGVQRRSYEISVSMSFARMQSPAVQALIGNEGQNLTGPLVRHNATFGNSVDFTKIIEVQ
ncbi:hypothetical protein ASA1KI_05050 [Opitutales bacterium ASA1]|uniref:DUF2511 domain-containing protein n=1 Tax=Congregicoccus parvus TaxID=3081749 RepID=UPI002B30BFA9|nr:hypothetical protein ASA1KI_05050 [Opitutales bacterium ASA1]